MPTLSVYRLHFRSGFHLGVRGVNQEESNTTLPSDTLFAAFTDGWRRLGGDVDAWLAPFCAAPSNPPFLLTSAFPFVGGVRFYPMPVDPGRLFSTPPSGKRVKRIRWLSEALFRRALKGEKLDAWLPPDEDERAAPKKRGEAPPAGLLLHHGQLWLAREPELDELPEWVRTDERTKRARPLHAYPQLDIWQESRIPRVTVDRTDSASTLFHTGQVRFAPQCGLWFGIMWRDAGRVISHSTLTYEESVQQLLAVFEGEGIGGSRSVGYGAFTLDVSASPAILADAQPGRLGWLLSRYHPASDAELKGITAPATAYRLTSVAGWLRSPDGPAQRRKRVHLLEEGSLIQVGGDISGDVVDVAPDYGDDGASLWRLPHRVYRAGFAVVAGLEREASNG